MTSLSPENTSPRVARRRRKVPKNPTVIKRFESPDEIRTKAKAVTLAIDRLRDDRGENLSPIKPFPSPDKREKIVKMIEISDERLENSFGFDKEEDRELITNILTVRTRRRGEKEIALLQKAFKRIKFFEQVEKEVDSISFNRIFQKLTLETFEAGETIFDYDDIGRKFYIIIKGSVYILLKKENAKNFAKRGSVRANNEEIGKARKNMRAYFEENELEENKQSYAEKCYPGFWIVRTMGEGDSFGEIALNKNSDGLRTATVLCKEKTTVGILSYNDYQAILGNLYERKYREKIDFLNNIDFLGHWTDNQLSSLILNIEEVKVKRKHVIFREGDAPTHMYFIFKGEVEIQKNSENEKDNNNDKIGALQRGPSQRAIQNGKIFAKSKTIKIQEPIKLGILTEKGYFGESEAMDSRPREFTAIAHSSEVRLFSVTKEKFCAIVQDQKSIKLVRENGHKKNTLREERILKFSHRNASLEISEITPVEEMSPATKTHRQTSSEVFFKNPLSVPSTPANANIFESNISMLPFNDQSMMGGLHYLDKGMGSGKIKSSNALSLQKSVSKVSSGSITDSELNHSKFIFQRQFTSLKNTKKGNATHIDRKKWIKQAIDVPVEQPSEIEETKETKETVTEKQIQYEIQENHDSLNFVKKGIPLTQIGKPGSLTCLSPTKAERKRNYNASLDCLDKIETALGQKQKDSIRHTRVTSIDNIKSMHLDTNTPRTAKSISTKSIKDMKKESLFAIKKIETSIKGILKKHQERVWPIQENGLPEKEYFSYRQPMAMNDGVSPRLPGSLASFRQSGDFIRNGLRNY